MYGIFRGRPLYLDRLPLFEVSYFNIINVWFLSGKIKNGIIDVHGTNGSSYTSSWYVCHSKFNSSIEIDNYDIAIIRFACLFYKQSVHLEPQNPTQANLPDYPGLL